MDTRHDRIIECMEEQKLRWNALAKYVGVSTAATTQWKNKKTRKLEGENLLLTAKFLKVNPDWIIGISPVKSRLSNIRPVKDYPDDDDVLIPQYQEVQLAAGQGCVNELMPEPSDHMTFKKSWISRKGLQVENLVVVYAKGDSMAQRVLDGDVVLINTDWRALVDGKIYAFSYGGLARLKRIRIRFDGTISLVSDNDPHDNLTETIKPETLEELNIIGQAIWIGGDLF